MNNYIEITQALSLKGCPFCGKSAFLSWHTYGCKNPVTFFIECNGCHAVTFEFDTPEEAAENWNRRATE